MKKVKYDIFISYRREAYDTANLVEMLPQWHAIRPLTRRI